MTPSTTSITDSGPLSAGNVPSYANEHDPSWEDVVRLVVIPSQAGRIREAAGAWEVLFSRIEQVRSALDQLSSGLQSWQGDAGEAYRGQLSELSTRVGQILDGHRPVVQLLNGAADNVDHALTNTPIPDELVDEAMDARQRFLDGGELDTQFHPGWFGDVLFPGFLNAAGEIFGFLTFGLSDKASDMLRDFLSDGDDKAKVAYQTLSGQHTGTVNEWSSFSGLKTGDVGAQTLTPSMPGGPSAPSAGPGTGSMASLAGAGGGPTVDPAAWMQDPGTSLAGAGGAGLTPVGTPSGGPGGLGPISGGAAGVGGTGGLTPGRVGGTTSAANAIRGALGGAPMVGGAAGAAGTRGAGAARGGVGGMPVGAAAGGAGSGGARGAGAKSGRGVASAVAGGRGGGVMGGHGGEAGGAEDHTTWLQEDEDVWGTESDAAPPVLGA